MSHRSLETVIFTPQKSLVKSTLHRGACENKQFLPTLANCLWHANVRKIAPWSDTHITYKKNERITNGESGEWSGDPGPLGLFLAGRPGKPGYTYVIKVLLIQPVVQIFRLFPWNQWKIQVYRQRRNYVTCMPLKITFSKYEHLKKVAFLQTLRSNGAHFRKWEPFQG